MDNDLDHDEKADWMRNPPTSIQEKAALIKRKQKLLKSPGKKGKFLRTMLRELNAYYEDALAKARQLQPLAHIRPSYEQSLVLNAWVYGFPFTAVYCANRIGKTFVGVLDKLLWIFPNNPAFSIFTPYRVGDLTDKINYQNLNKGKLVHVLQRPNIATLDAIIDLARAYTTDPDALQFNPKDPSSPIPPSEPDPKQSIEFPANAKYLQWLQKKLSQPPYRTSLDSVYPDAPWNRGGTIWFGAPDHKHHKEIMFPIWKNLLPSTSIERWAPSDQEITIKVVTATGRITYWNLVGKSYESEDTKWSSGAVDMIMLTEGVTPAIFKEVKLRFKDPGIGSHDFTPYESSNVGASTHLAKRIRDGLEVMPLRTFVFTGFSVRNVPRHIMSKKKQEGLIAAYENDPEGKARIDGEFFTSSEKVIDKYKPEINLLPLTPSEMFAKWPNGRIYRGLDPGLDHPTACAWSYVLPSGVKIIYRVFSKPGLTIPQRCEQVAIMSGNKLVKKKWGPGPMDFYLVESHITPTSEIANATAADYHIFKKDENTGQCYATNYQVGGLTVIESTHMKPEERATTFNSKLHPSEFVPHPLTDVPPSPKVFFLQYGPGVMEMLKKWEELYWDRIRTGDNKGQPKDKVPIHGDDELDACCYATDDSLGWTSYKPDRTMVADTEPSKQLAEASRQIQQINNQTACIGDFATVAKDGSVSNSPSDASANARRNPKQPYAGEVVFFGGSESYGPNIPGDDDDE